MENFWFLLKHGLDGAYVSVDPFHLFRHINQQAFRYSNWRHEDGGAMTDADRFSTAVSGIVCKRLIWNQLAGKTPAQAEVIGVGKEAI